MAGESLDRLIAALIRGDALDDRQFANLEADALLRRAEAHGVLPLVAEQVACRAELPLRIREPLVDRACRHAALDLARERELRRLVRRLQEEGISALLIKGAHLAYCHYERPDLRPRIDTDLLIARPDRQRVVDLLLADGYESTGHVAGTLVMYQGCYVARDHVVDVHWKIANPQVFADLVSYEELCATAQPLPALGAGAVGLSDVHALLVACVHRVAHHQDSDRLIWLYDIHLLASRLSPEQWRAFEDLCAARGVTQVCRRGLDRASAVFHTTVPPFDLARPRTEAAAVEAATAAFLNADRPHVHQVVGDLRALSSWRDRVRLVGQHVFPPADYIRRQYAPESSAPLALLYLRRALTGARKWLAKP